MRQFRSRWWVSDPLARYRQEIARTPDPNEQIFRGPVTTKAHLEALIGTARQDSVKLARELQLHALAELQREIAELEYMLAARRYSG